MCAVNRPSVADTVRPLLMRAELGNGHGDCAPNYSEMRTQKLLTQDNQRAFKLFIFQDVSPAGAKNFPFFRQNLLQHMKHLRTLHARRQQVLLQSQAFVRGQNVPSMRVG